MMRFLLLFSCSAALLGAADLAGVHSVYLLPMSRGMDQYLANRLTGDRVFQVVTDPKKADAIITDRIGEAFEVQMDSLYPPPRPEKPTPPKDSKEAKKSTEMVAGSPLGGETMNKVTDPSLNSSFGRGKGMVFIVDVK